MADKVSFLRQAWNILRGRHPQENADGTITTKFGHRIIPYRVTVSDRGGLSANAGQHMYQPRVSELKKQMEPFLRTAASDRITLDTATGEFFLDSDLQKNGRGNVAVLGQIDMALEEGLFRAATTRISLQKLFGDASHANPIVVAEDGTVYPKNNPSAIRGSVALGPTVAGPAAARRK